MYRPSALASLALLYSVRAQQVGTNTAETHPSLTWQQCTGAQVCTTQNGKVVLDSNWRWLHSTSGFTNCYTGNTWDATLCPNPTTCANNCALEGANYSGTYGITTSGNALTLKFVTQSAQKNVGSRTYLMNTADTAYHMFRVNGMEFSFDVDVSQLPCGLNGALYFVEMVADGGLSAYPTNKAGAKYGTGYCDSQCPRDIKFINGLSNSEGWTGSSTNSGVGNYGTCCNEMDIWEANSISTAYTPHPCDPVGQYRCTGSQCNSNPDRYTGVCDPDGCDFNSYRQGDTTFYGPGKTVDTTKKMTVITQFITNDGTQNGELIDIRRFYIQDGRVIPNSCSNINGITPTRSITKQYCDEQKATFGDHPSFQNHGGLKVMGESLNRGHVLVLSIWDDYAVNMLWLDAPYPTDADPNQPGVSRGTCSITSGKPEDVEANHPNAQVIYSNIKFGTIGSTYAGLTAPPCDGAPPASSTTRPATSTTRASTTVRSSTTSVRTSTTSPRSSTSSTRSSTTSTRTSSANTATQTHWGQCGGIGYSGPTVCASPYRCVYSNDGYSQCL